MSVKMVVTDLDGTLFNSQEEVAEENRRAFHNVIRQGVIPAVATGRIKSEARYAFEAIGADRYFMGMNGCRTVDMQAGKIIYEHLLPRNIINEIYQRLDALNIFFQMYTDTGVKCTPFSYAQRYSSGLAAPYLARFGEQIAELPLEMIDNAQVYKFLVVAQDERQLDAVRQAFTHYGDVKLVSSLHNYLEIIPAQVNKGVALKALCRYLSIDTSEVMVIGDSENDIEILQIAGVGVAMDNAKPHVKAAARFVVPSNDQHGVAVALNEILPTLI